MGFTNVRITTKYFNQKILTPIIILLVVFIGINYLIFTPTGQQDLDNVVENTNDFISALSAPWLQRSLMAALIIGTICAIVGVFVVLRGLIFLGESITHSAFAGAAFGILMIIEPIWTIILFAILAALTVGYVNEKKVMNDEIIIGVTFTFMMALAIVFIGLLNFYSVQIYTILFGNLLFISIEDFYVMIGVGVLVIGIILLLKKELYFMTFDVDMAALTGIPVRLYNYIFLILVALTISVSISSVGALLVFAMVVVPAAAAYQWTFRLNRMILYAVIFGVISTLVGLYISFVFDFPTGSTMVITITIIFFLSFIYSPKREATKNIISCKYCHAALLKGEECQDCLAHGIRHIHDGEITRISRKDLPQTEIITHTHNGQDGGS